MRRILDSIDAELTPAAAPWAADRERSLTATAADAWHRFSEAFGRWRQLYQSARAQLIEANRRSEMHGLGPTSARRPRSSRRRPTSRSHCWKGATASGGSDFYTYRYLATEGFLPGYNFPRLPLYAYRAGRGRRASKAAYLQRARFLAIAEFGPRSLIYHEGRAYRVYKAKLPPGIRTEEGGRLRDGNVLFVCDECGAAHQQASRNAAMPARADMGGIHPIRNVLRIDNVETQPAERITANDEDRQRQGFEIQTVFAWPQRDGGPDVTSAVASDDDGPILSLTMRPAPPSAGSTRGCGAARKRAFSVSASIPPPAAGPAAQ